MSEPAAPQFEFDSVPVNSKCKIRGTVVEDEMSIRWADYVVRGALLCCLGSSS